MSVLKNGEAAEPNSESSESDENNDGNRDSSRTPELIEIQSYINPETTGIITASGEGDGNDNRNNSEVVQTNGSFWWKKIVPLIGATVAVAAAPLAIRAMGAGSVADGMVSSSVIASGGGIAAGSLIARLRSTRDAGLFVWVCGTLVANLIRGNRNQTEEEEESSADGNNEESSADGNKEVSSADGNKKESTTDWNEEVWNEVPRDGKENSSDEEWGRQSQATSPELMSIVVAETDGCVRRFDVLPSQPLQRLFDLYYDETGLSPESVQLEFNHLPLDGSETPSELGIENDDVIKARRI